MHNTCFNRKQPLSKAYTTTKNIFKANNWKQTKNKNTQKNITQRCTQKYFATEHLKIRRCSSHGGCSGFSHRVGVDLIIAKPYFERETVTPNGWLVGHKSAHRKVIDEDERQNHNKAPSNCMRIDTHAIKHHCTISAWFHIHKYLCNDWLPIMNSTTLNTSPPSAARKPQPNALPARKHRVYLSPVAVSLKNANQRNL